MNHVAACPEPDTLNIISLCAGGRGLDRALELAIPTARTVLYVERESFAVAGLVAQIEAGLVAPAAVWSDVRTLNGRRLRGRVAGVIGGIPCQPHSLAGRRGGSDDERDLWAPRGARRVIAQSRPVLVIIENVGGFLTARDDQIPGAHRVWRDLQKLGYAVTGCIVRASDMGLPHERERVFIIGVADHAGGAWCDWLLRTSGSGPGPSELSDQGHGGAVRAANDEVADDRDRRAFGEPRDLRGEAGEDRASQEDGSQRHTGDGGADLRLAGVGLADAGSSRLQGRGSRGSRAEGLTAAERGGGEVVHAAGNRRREGRTEPELRGGRRAASGAGDEMVNPARDDGRLHAGSGQEGLGAPDAGGRGQVVDALGGGCDGRPEGAFGVTQRGDAEQLAGADDHGQRLADANQSEFRRIAPTGEQPLLQRDHGAGQRPILHPPGPGDVGSWRIIAEDCPELLPALSGYDRFRIAMRDEGLAPDSARPPAHLDTEAKRRRSVEGGSAGWVDAWTGEPVHPTRLQEATQSALRRVADVMATRIDELRLLGNGVADAQGGLAIRIGLHDLAAGGSANATELVRLMETHP